MPTLAEALKGLQEKVNAEEKAKAEAAPPSYVYRPAIVTFIDILGFSELVKTANAAEIGKLLALLGDASAGEVSEDNWPAGLARSIAFSDNVVRVCPIDSTDPRGALFHELLSLVMIQAQLANMGALMRGGVTVGDIHFSGTTIFGPAMVRAYELESKLAIYPRIVLDPHVFENYVKNPSMKGSAHSLEKDLEYIDALLHDGGDGLYSVDYVRAIKDQLEGGQAYLEFTWRHRDLVKKEAAKFSRYNSVKQKLAWLANYHNTATLAVYPDAEKVGITIDMSELMFPGI